MAILNALENNEGSTRSYQLKSPSNLENLYPLHCATKTEVETAVENARAAQTAWANTPLTERIDLFLNLREVILKQQDKIIKTVRDETGKTLQEAFIFEIYASCDFISYFSKIAKKALKDESRRPHGVLALMKKVKIHYKPLGVVAVVSPWNGPFVLCLNPCIQAALAGNTVVAKGSEITPRSASIINELLEEAGFPKNIIQVLEGDGQTGADLVASNIDKVVFTGSTKTGKIIAQQCAKRLIPFTLELGGNDAMIVCADANLDHAAHAALWGGCVNSGHFCCGTERIYVEAAVYDAFIQKVVAQAKTLRQGSSHQYDEDLGAIFWDQQLHIIEEHVSDALERGAKLHCGGARDEQQKGLYYPATILSDVSEEALMSQNETFGPVLAVTKVNTIEQAINLANKSDYGLHGSVWTQNKAQGLAIAKRIETGSMAINDIGMIYGVPVAPFGGVKNSGFGKAHDALSSLRNFCVPQAIVSGRYTGNDNGYPFNEDSFKQLKKFSNFMWNTRLGKFFFG